jgi:hypothetical protein
MDTLDLCIGLGIFHPKSAKDFSHVTKAKAACELAGDSQKWPLLRSLTDNSPLRTVSLDLIYQGVRLPWL